jgi:cytoskeletal protein RodZ
VHTARRLRDIRNDLGLTHEQVAQHTGLPLDRIKTYASILGVSDHLLRFFEERVIPVKVAAGLHDTSEPPMRPSRSSSSVST